MNINDLDEYTIQHIFSYLTFKELTQTVSKVCKLWKKYADSGCYYTNCKFFDADNDRTSFNVTVINDVLRNHCHEIRSLSLSCYDIHDHLPALFTLMADCDKLIDLRLLYLEMESANYRYLMSTIKSCDNLRSFKIEKSTIQFGSGNEILKELNERFGDTLTGLTLDINNVTVQGLHLPIFPIRLRHLTDVRLVVQNVIVNTRWLKALVESNAEHVRVLKVVFLEVNGNPIDGGTIFNTIGRCVNLNTLSLKFHHFPLHDILNDEGFHQIGQLKSLKKLVINHANGISKQAFLRYFELPHVKNNIVKVNLAGCRHVDDDVFHSAFSRCPHLKSLNIWRH